MAISRQKKEEIVRELHEKTEGAKYLVFVNFHSMSVQDSRELRGRLRDAHVDFKVAKKRLVMRVLDGLGLSGDMPKLEGELAVAFSKDEVSAPQILSKFRKEKKSIELLGGVLDGAYVDAEVIAQLASIPSQEVLFGQVVSSISAPLRGLVGVLGGPQRSFISVLKNISDSK